MALYAFLQTLRIIIIYTSLSVLLSFINHAATVTAAYNTPPWYPTPRGGTINDKWIQSYAKAANLVSEMTLVEKVNITSGVGDRNGLCTGNTGQVGRLGFPSLCLQDSPIGIASTDNITAFPAGITLGMTWNTDLIFQKGRLHALEAKGKGVNVVLGPVVGPIGRSPLGGRNWEGFGADPVIQAKSAVAMIDGIQSRGVMATVKHLIGNEQEFGRRPYILSPYPAVSSDIDDRTLHEIYIWPFADSIRAGVTSVMCAYNRVNSTYACENSKLLNGILKDELGFQGFVVSDWLAQTSGVNSAIAGLDMSMPGDAIAKGPGQFYWSSNLTRSVLNGTVSNERLDDMVTRIVASWFYVEQNNVAEWPLPPPDGKGGPNFSSYSKQRIGPLYDGTNSTDTGVINQFVDVQGKGELFHGLLARKLAAEGTVLLKNTDNILPLNNDTSCQNTDGQSCQKLRVGVFGYDASVDEKAGINPCFSRACNKGTLIMGWGSGIVDTPYIIDPLSALRDVYDDNTVEITTHLNQSFDGVDKGALLDQDLCFVFIASNSGESDFNIEGQMGDRNNLFPLMGGDELASEVGMNCGMGKGSTIVIMHSVGPVIVENWIDLPTVKAVILANLPGQESGRALTDILFGIENPSGHLTYTMAKRLEDYGPSAVIHREFADNTRDIEFEEGLYFDYRHFDKYGITPRYEFGYGLSYTTFNLTNLRMRRLVQNFTELPATRIVSGIEPPSYNYPDPDISQSYFPQGFRKVFSYLYPYLNEDETLNDISMGTPYSYPEGFTEKQPPSPAGGGLGGNDDLYREIAQVQVTVYNSGNRTGSAVVQLYVSLPQDYRDTETMEVVDFPVRVLRNYSKVELLPGEFNSAEVLFGLTRKDLSYWSPSRQNWVIPTSDRIQVSVGFSSRDLLLTGYI